MTKSYSKICKNCKGQDTKKDGTRKGRQSYKCKQCGHVWLSKCRKKIEQKIVSIYKDFALHKQTYKELSVKYGISVKTIQKYLDAQNFDERKKVVPTEIILLIDTTYFGTMGLMLFKDKETKNIIHYQIVAYETNDAYRKGIAILQKEGWVIRAIVCDGRRGLLGGFGSIPTQMCHFHQQQIIRRYITKKPILQANKDLKKIVDRLHRTEKECLKMELEERYTKYEKFIKEKGVNSKGRSYFIHRKTRSAYYSLKRNLEFLFIYQDYYGILDIPNTTNGLEAVFSHLKYKVNLHRGLSKDRKIKLILFLIHSR